MRRNRGGVGDAHSTAALTRALRPEHDATQIQVLGTTVGHRPWHVLQRLSTHVHANLESTTQLVYGVGHAIARASHLVLVVHRHAECFLSLSL